MNRENLQIFYSPIHVTEERYGKIPRYYICGTMDGAIPFDLQKAMIAATPCEEVYCLESCHEPYLVREQELIYILHTIAQN